MVYPFLCALFHPAVPGAPRRGPPEASTDFACAVREHRGVALSPPLPLFLTVL